MQIRLWNDCINGCTFCSLKNKKITKVNDKILRLKKLYNLKDTKIGLIGGEFFEGQLKGCEEEWLSMIASLRCDSLFISANLIREPYLLKETLGIRNDILICTSYDAIGRFSDDSQKEDWLERVKSLPNVFCTIIPTQDIIEDPFIDRIPCGINLCEPHLGIDWYSKVDKRHYHDILIKENKIFNLPRRYDLLNWICKHPKILALMKNYKATHFNDIYTFDKNNNLIQEEFHRFNDDNFVAECGHQYFSRCYADSDKCFACDLEEL
jgi:hypothetical protein